MIEMIEFANFKALRQTTLPLAPFTLLLGPNGSGKSTVLQALRGAAAIAVGHAPGMPWKSLVSVPGQDNKTVVEVKLHVRWSESLVVVPYLWKSNGDTVMGELRIESGKELHGEPVNALRQWLSRMQVFALDATAIAQPVAVNSGPLQFNGHGLAAVLDDLKDNHPERWEALLDELGRWLPEYDYILFDKPDQGQKAIALRTRSGKHRIPAKELSQGTLIALALFTLAYLPNPPSLIGLEEIDRGLHPRLLRHLQDALYRLSYPESCGEQRAAIQVVATTHSPYLLDLYRDHPEEIVLARKEGLEVEMKRLTEIDHFEEILGDSPLSEVWYSGVLGGVSVKP